MFFDRMQAGVSKKARFPDRVRCDVTLKLSAPVEASATILIDLSGNSHVTGNGMAAATFTMQGRKEEINSHPMDDVGVQRFAAIASKSFLDEPTHYSGFTVDLFMTRIYP